MGTFTADEARDNVLDRAVWIWQDSAEDAPRRCCICDEPIWSGTVIDEFDADYTTFCDECKHAQIFKARKYLDSFLVEALTDRLNEMVRWSE